MMLPVIEAWSDTERNWVGYDGRGHSKNEENTNVSVEYNFQLSGEIMKNEVFLKTVEK